MTNKTIFFDGHCNLCNALVQFVIRHGDVEKFRFGSLQGQTAVAFIEKHNLGEVGSKVQSTIIFFDNNNNIYTKSSAILRICKSLKGGWPVLYTLIIVPKFIRDFFYTIISRNRYKFWGEREFCIIPEKEISHLFLD
jgi:predicted DCC family thiol-disulfide oxidoreductase YuxK